MNTSETKVPIKDDMEEAKCQLSLSNMPWTFPLVLNLVKERMTLLDATSTYMEETIEVYTTYGKTLVRNSARLGTSGFAPDGTGY